MKYIGLTKCPYCGKGINIIRIWSMKSRGEYMCPRCKGISNIYLSPLIYVVAVLAIAVSVLISFFEISVWNNVSIMTTIKALIPFAVFYVVSLFLVYLKKPVIKKIRKTADGRFVDQDGTEMVMKMGKFVPLNQNK